MAKIYAFPYHRLKGVDVPCDCASDDGRWRCVVCAGGLADCVVCGGAEASLPSDCPGERMHSLVCDAVQDGELDYDRRLGWVRRDSALRELCTRDNRRK